MLILAILFMAPGVLGGGGTKGFSYSGSMTRVLITYMGPRGWIEETTL